MAVLMVSYDLNRPGQDYSTLHDRIKSHGAWWHHLDSTWLVTTSLSPVQMRDDLAGYIDSGDELLVIDVTGDSWATKGIAEPGNNWLHSNL